MVDLPLKNLQLRRPIRERQQQAVQIGIAGQQFAFDGRDLPAAALDLSMCARAGSSRRSFVPFGADNTTRISLIISPVAEAIACTTRTLGAACRSAIVAKQHRDFGDAKLARSFQSEVPVHDFAIAAREHRKLAAELAEGGARA